jgi:hypothetical protein
MCLILIRDPEVVIDFANIEAAAENNPHGWGYVIPDRGKLEIRRHYDKKGNDPDAIMRVVEDNKDKQLFLHLRYCTHGDQNKANVHPFPAMQRRKDGMQVWVMHNGTVGGFKEAGAMSDTFHFTQKLINPLLKRFVKFTGKQRLLQDPMLADIIEKYAGGWSKFVLIDEYGNHRIIGDGHTPKDGLWISNEYSFKPKYRYPTPAKKWDDDDDKDDYKAFGYSSRYSDNYGAVVKTQAEKEEEYAEFWPSTTEVYEPPFPRECSTDGHGATNGHATTVTKGSLIPVKDPELHDPIDLEARESFCEVLNLKDIRELGFLSEDDLFELVTEFPEHIVLCIRDLLLELDNVEG